MSVGFTEFGSGKYPLGHVERHLTLRCCVSVLLSLYNNASRTFLSVPDDSFPDTSWAFAHAHMTSALWIVLTRYLNKQEGTVTTPANWCHRVISRHTDSKAESSLCSLVVVQVSAFIHYKCGRESFSFCCGFSVATPSSTFCCWGSCNYCFCSFSNRWTHPYLPKYNSILLGTRIQSGGTRSLPEAIRT